MFENIHVKVQGMTAATEEQTAATEETLSLTENIRDAMEGLGKSIDEFNNFIIKYKEKTAKLCK